ncbi:hypothetical protein [Maribacter sp. 2307ULW6-5]|uniref:hypothetical protein n=1 Tax=Maribacter sp. 2307ULW6-5 TaxID=3386275 RepID=UPI0039BC8A34
MNSLKKLMPWRFTLICTIVVLSLLNILSFYGLYSEKFYLFKVGNYIFPLMTLVHFVFLYVMCFKIKEEELSDPQMRNLEYALYFIFSFYLYKFGETIYKLFSVNQFEEHLIPASFVPMAIVMAVLYGLLLILGVMTYKYRTEMVGDYNFNQMNQHVDSWKS